MKIFLIGFMGSGKTTVGKKLAKKLNFKHLDIDKEVEKITNLKIGEIFKDLGEQNFRRIESNTLKSISFNKIVISTGGGTPCFLKNMDWIKKKGISIYNPIHVF